MFDFTSVVLCGSVRSPRDFLPLTDCYNQTDDGYEGNS